MDTIQEEGLEQDVLDSLALADSAIQQEGLASLVLFEGLRARRIRDNIGNGDVHNVIEFDDYFTTPATTANELTLEARVRLVNGVEYDVPQVTLTLPDASGVDTLVSNQTLIMFETSVVNVTVSNTFYAGSDLDTSSLVWANLDSATQQGYLEDTKNNLFVDGGNVKQYVFSHVITNLTQDYTKGDPQAIIDAGYTQGTVGDHFARWTKTDIVAESIAMVQRRNQGAYEPTVNPNGTAEFGDSLPWYSTTDDRATVANCFTTVGDGSIIGADSGRSDGKFFDAIDASDVHDLRMSSRRVPRAELREQYKRKAIAGTVRGYEGVPFTKVFSSVGAVTGEYTIVNQDNTSAVVAERPQLHSQANLSWTDIVGDPVRIAATFPNGVEGRWIPVIPSGSLFYPLSRKFVSSAGSTTTILRVFTSDDGTNWSQSTSLAVDTTLNGFTTTYTSHVVLNCYITQAHFTEDDVNSEVIELGDVFGTSESVFSLYGSSLIDKVATGVTGKTRTSVGLNEYFLLEASNNLHTAAGTYRISHDTIGLGNAGDSPAVKTLDYLSESTGVGKLMLAYKEMVYDASKDAVGDATVVTVSTSFAYVAGVDYYLSHASFGRVIGNRYKCLITTSKTAGQMSTYNIDKDGNIFINDIMHFQLWDGNGWGDNAQFEISDNQVDDIDDNGNDIVRGTASFGIPFYLVESI